MSAHQCKHNPLETGEHQWTKRTDSMGDPDGRYGESTWQVNVCRWCGIEQQEIEHPAMTQSPAESAEMSLVKRLRGRAGSWTTWIVDGLYTEFGYTPAQMAHHQALDIEAADHIEQLEQRQKWLDEVGPPKHPDDERHWAMAYVREKERAATAEQSLSELRQQLAKIRVLVTAIRMDRVGYDTLEITRAIDAAMQSSAKESAE